MKLVTPLVDHRACRGGGVQAIPPLNHGRRIVPNDLPFGTFLVIIQFSIRKNF